MCLEYFELWKCENLETFLEFVRYKIGSVEMW